MIRPLTQSDAPALLAYLEQWELQTVYLLSALKAVGLCNTGGQFAGDYYGDFAPSGALQGVAGFLNLGVGVMHMENAASAYDMAKVISGYRLGTLMGVAYVMAEIIHTGGLAAFRRNDEWLCVQEGEVPEEENALVIKTMVPKGKALRFAKEVRNGIFGDRVTTRELQQEIVGRPSKEDHLLGYIGEKPVAQGMVQGYGQQYALLGSIATDPEFRGNGYGSAMVTTLVKRVRQKGFTPMLMVRKDNENALALYRRLGFKESGEYTKLFF